MSTEVAAKIPKSSPTLYNVLTSEGTINKLKSQIVSNVDPQRLVRVIWGAITKTPKLLKATPESVMMCAADCARLGLEPILGRAYLIPFDNNKKGTTECQLMIGYQGLIDLARRSGMVTAISARCVYKNDKFKFSINESGPVLKHEPCLTADKGELTGAYCVAKFKDGGTHVEYMNKNEIDSIRSRSKAKGSGPWVTDYDEMAKKTVIRRATKLFPLSVTDKTFSDALAKSDECDFGNDFLESATIVEESSPANFVGQAAKRAIQEDEPIDVEPEPATSLLEEESKYEEMIRAANEFDDTTKLNNLLKDVTKETQSGELTAENASELKRIITGKIAAAKSE